MLRFSKHRIFESAPRIPKNIDYWKNKGKRGKDVCLIFHDDMDGIVSAILMKEWLKRQGFNIVKYGIINYQEGWDAIQLDKSLINIALDYAEDVPQVDVYMDHHGQFEEELRFKQERPSVKTKTGSAAEGIALQIGVPFSKDTQNWIDMIDSAKYADYDIDIKGILEFDLKSIKKDKNSKLKFAASFNQMLKRSDHKTFIEVVNASKYPSIFNLFRLFKLFYPKNNPDWRSGEEKEFKDDARWRIQTMKNRTKGKGQKIRYTSQSNFWSDFAEQIQEDGKMKWKLNPSSFQIIGNIMYVPSGTWANALRAKSIFSEEVDNGNLPNDPKLNFVVLQYGNTIQIADLRTKIKDMKEEDLPTTPHGVKIDDLGKYTEGLVKNFEDHLGYYDKRTVSGGHHGIGTVSNIFGECQVEPYKGVKFLDLFKNKIITDISGVRFKLDMPWNELDPKRTLKEEEINAKVINRSDIRSEEYALTEKKERKFLTYAVQEQILDDVKEDNFKNENLKILFKAFKLSSRYEISNIEEMDSEVVKKIKFFNIEEDKDKSVIADTYIFDYLLENLDFDKVYESTNSEKRKAQRKELKRLLYLAINIAKGYYIENEDIEELKENFDKWNK